MEISAQDLASAVYGGSTGHVLAACFRADGGLSAVIDQGIRGAPKYSLTVQETSRALAQCEARGVGTIKELRETFGTEEEGRFAALATKAPTSKPEAKQEKKPAKRKPKK